MGEAVELAWAAGFYDGEGCTSGRRKRYFRRDRGYWDLNRQIHLQVSQVHREPLDKLQSILGGTIKGPVHYDRPGVNNRPIFKWYLSGQERVYEALLSMWPYLSAVKRAQAIRAAGVFDGEAGTS